MKHLKFLAFHKNILDSITRICTNRTINRTDPARKIALLLKKLITSEINVMTGMDPAWTGTGGGGGGTWVALVSSSHVRHPSFKILE